MIVKSYEIQKKRDVILKYNLFLLYGENIGLKKDIKKNIQFEIKQKNNNVEISSLYENESSIRKLISSSVKCFFVCL